jgi:hypothetical protein
MDKFLNKLSDISRRLIPILVVLLLVPVVLHLWIEMLDEWLEGDFTWKLIQIYAWP